MIFTLYSASFTKSFRQFSDKIHSLDNFSVPAHYFSYKQIIMQSMQNLWDF